MLITTAGRQWRLTLLALAAITLVVMAGMTLADRSVPGGVAPIGARDAAIAAAARSHHAPLAESAPTLPFGAASLADPGEPLIKSAE